MRHSVEIEFDPKTADEIEKGLEKIIKEKNFVILS